MWFADAVTTAGQRGANDLLRHGVARPAFQPMARGYGFKRTPGLVT